MREQAAPPRKRSARALVDARRMLRLPESATERIEREANKRLGPERASILRDAPHWFRGVRNGWPVYIYRARMDLIRLFSSLLERLPAVDANWRAFLDLAERSELRDEFFSVVGDWLDRAFELLRFQYASIEAAREGRVIHVSYDGFWDLTQDRGRARSNPRIDDDLTVLALCASRARTPIGSGVLRLVWKFYSRKGLVEIASVRALKESVGGVLSARPDLNWCVRYPFTATIRRLRLPRVTLPDDKEGILRKCDSIAPNPQTPARDAFLSLS